MPLSNNSYFPFFFTNFHASKNTKDEDEIKITIPSSAIEIALNPNTADKGV